MRKNEILSQQCAGTQRVCVSKSERLSLQCTSRDKYTQGVCVSKSEILSQQCTSRDKYTQGVCVSKNEILSQQCTSRDKYTQRVCVSKSEILSQQCTSRYTEGVYFSQEKETARTKQIARVEAPNAKGMQGKV